MASMTFPLLLDAWTVVPVTRALVQLGVPDAVEVSGSTSIDALAAKVGADPDMLYRSLRYVSSFGVFTEGPDRTISHSETSLSLRVGAALHHKTLYRCSDEMVMTYIQGFTAVLKDPSKSAFEHVHGEDYFTSWLPRHPESEALFGKYMSASCGQLLPVFADCCPWPHEGVVADIGGGNGHLLEAVLRKREKVSGVLFDLPLTISSAKSHWPPDSVMHTERLSFAPGDFFSDLHVVADVYVLKWILHDWADDRCVTILSNIRAAAKESSIVLVIDMQMPEGSDNSFNIVKCFDIHMATGYGGKERTRSQLENIALAAGWSVRTQTQLASTLFFCTELRQASTFVS